MVGEERDWGDYLGIIEGYMGLLRDFLHFVGFCGILCNFVGFMRLFGGGIWNRGGYWNR